MVERKNNHPQEQSLDQVRLGDSAKQDFEQKMLQSELISSKQVTLQEILNQKGADIVGLLHMPFNFQSRDMGDSVLYIASFSENQASFGGERLIEVLRGAKPVRMGMRKGPQDKDGIVADWKMLKENVRIQKSSSPGYNSLYQEHTAPTSPITRKLGEHFREIGENHFRRFLDAIFVDSEDSVSRDLEHDFKRLVSGEKALDMYSFDFIMSAYYIFPEAIHEDQRFALAEFLKTKGLNIDITLDSDALFRETRSLVNRLINPERKDLLTDFYNSLSDIEKIKFIYSGIADFSGYILVDEEGDLYLGKLNYLQGIKKIDRNQIEIRDGESYLKVSFVRDEETGFREPRIVERYIVPQEGEIVPIIVWQKDKATGARSYFCGRVSEELIRAFPDVFSENHDTLLGQIVVAAYSDHLKHKLPTKLPLVKGGVEQDMLEAQMLAYVRLFAAAHLKISPVILGLECLAPKR